MEVISRLLARSRRTPRRAASSRVAERSTRPPATKETIQKNIPGRLVLADECKIVVATADEQKVIASMQTQRQSAV